MTPSNNYSTVNVQSSPDLSSQLNSTCSTTTGTCSTRLHHPLTYTRSQACPYHRYYTSPLHHPSIWNMATPYHHDQPTGTCSSRPHLSHHALKGHTLTATPLYDWLFSNHAAKICHTQQYAPSPPLTGGTCDTCSTRHNQPTPAANFSHGTHLQLTTTDKTTPHQMVLAHHHPHNPSFNSPFLPSAR